MKIKIKILQERKTLKIKIRSDKIVRGGDNQARRLQIDTHSILAKGEKH